MPDVKYDQPSSSPTPKVAAGGIGGSVSVILIWVANSVFKVEIPAEVAAAIATVAGFVSAYFTRDSKPVKAVDIIQKEGK